MAAVEGGWSKQCLKKVNKQDKKTLEFFLQRGGEGRAQEVRLVSSGKVLFNVYPKPTLFFGDLTNFYYYCGHTYDNLIILFFTELDNMIEYKCTSLDLNNGN